MKVLNVVSELETELKETQNESNKRVEALWQKLDPSGQGELDFKGLQKAMRRIDHPMKNADDMLRQMVKQADTNGDGKVQYEEFRIFVEQAESRLWALFRPIDRDHDGRLGKEELQCAFQRAGIAVPDPRLSDFFDGIDLNRDGFISFEEWRDFLLFMPAHNNDSGLELALSFFSSIVTLNAEGDSMVSDETPEGLGTTGSLLHILFGSLIQIAKPDPAFRPPMLPAPTSADIDPALSLPQAPSLPLSNARSANAKMAGNIPAFPFALNHKPRQERREAADLPGIQDVQGIQWTAAESLETRLTDFLPAPGYLLAGAVSGGISRTATAPLDRLKVYLLVNTKASRSTALDAAKHGHPLRAARKSAKPIGKAILSLYRAGGLRTFFAGNGLNVGKIMPESAIKFGSYEASKRILAAHEGHNDPCRIGTVSKFIAGGVGGMTAQFCVYPIDTLKFRLQCETIRGGPTGNALLVKTAKNTWKDSGMRAVYRGLGLGLVGMFPYSAIDIGTFEFLKKKVTKHKARFYGLHEEDAAPGNVATAILGASSGALGATAVYPLNVLRTRLQTQGTAMHPLTYTGIWDVAQRTVRNEGWRGLYKGLTPNLFKVAPALSITWVCYENMKKALELP